jgi:hypothetical protein
LQSHEEIYLSWNKDTVKDDVIFEHLYELSGGKLNLLQRALNTTDLLRTNKRVSNKIAPAGPPKIQSNKNKMGNQTIHKTKIETALGLL